MRLFFLGVIIKVLQYVVMFLQMEWQRCAGMPYPQ